MPIGIAWIGDGAEPDGLMADTVAALAREYVTRVTRVRMGDRPPAPSTPRAGSTRREPCSRGSSHRCHLRSAMLGVTDVDLFIPVLTFVFGEAQLAGTGGRRVARAPPRHIDPRPPGSPPRRCKEPSTRSG